MVAADDLSVLSLHLWPRSKNFKHKWDADDQIAARLHSWGAI